MFEPQELDWLATVQLDSAKDPGAIERLAYAAQMHQPHLTLATDTGSLRIMVRREGQGVQLARSTDGHISVVGRLFSRQCSHHPGWAEEDIARMLGGTLEETARSLTKQIWGSFVAFIEEPHTGASFAFRDPGGACPVYVLSDDGIIVLSPAIPAWLCAVLGTAPRIDWTMLGRALGDPRLIAYRSLFENVRMIPPGEALQLDSEHVLPVQLWRPSDVLAEPNLPVGRRAADVLRSTVEGCLRSWSRGHERTVLELSGGFDSCVVLSTLMELQPLRPPQCINFFTDYPGGDERDFARSAAAHFGAELVEKPASEHDMDYALQLSGEQPAIPYLGMLDPLMETEIAALARSTQASAIITGQGGDGIFFQMPTSLTAVDFLRDNGLKKGWWRYARDAAMRERTSLWRIARNWLRGFRQEPASPIYAAHLHGPALRDLRPDDIPIHPWLEDLAGCPPAKRMQIEAIINNSLSHGPALRRGVAMVLHPLLAQPLVELAIALPCWQQAFGTQDRALARAAFADRLPEAILKRGYKSEATSYYNRCVVENLPWFRAHLLDGVLVRRGLLDGQALDQALTEESLLWSSDYQPLIVYASFEAWARWWG